MQWISQKILRIVDALTSTRTLIAIFTVCGLFALWIGCRMAWKFGITISSEHAYFLVLVSIMAAFIFSASDIFRGRNWTGMSRFAQVAGAFFIVIELWSHVGYTVGQRHENVTGATVQRARYDDNRDSVAQAARDIVSAEARLQQLRWIGVVTAVGIRAEIDTKNEAVRQETSRGGCGPKCLKLREELADLEKRRGAAEERDDIEKKMAATKAWLEKAKERAAKTDVGESSVIEQANLPAKLWSMSLNPDDTAIGWSQIVIGLLMALGATALSPTFLTIAFRLANAVHTDDIPLHRPSSRVEPEPQVSRNVAREPAVPVQPAKPSHTINVSNDSDVWQAIHKAFSTNKAVAA